MAKQENEQETIIAVAPNPDLVATPTQETDEERRRREDIEARHDEVMEAVRNVQQGKPMVNTGNNGDSSGVQNGTYRIVPTQPKTKTEEEAKEWWNSYWAEQMRKEKERDLKRIEGQRFGKSLGDLAHVIGDMIQATNGAVVLPRDIQKKYDNLNAQQKQIIDTYWARMEMLRKEQEAKDAAAQKMEWEKEKMEQQKEIAEKLEEGRNQRAADDLEYKKWKTAQDNAAKIESARRKAQASVKRGENHYVIPFAGIDYNIPKSYYDGRIGQLYAYLNQNNLFPETSGANDELKAISFMMRSGQNGHAPESSKAKVQTAVLTALPTITDDTHVQEIIKILKGTTGRQSTSTTIQKTKKPIKGFNGN